jgi:DDB1- and CUL4-associated factor 6
MKFTLHDRLLRREIGERGRYAHIQGIYGDSYFVDQLDIVNELKGHDQCVNALR